MGLRVHTFTYVGDGIVGKTISCPFTPLYVFIQRHDGTQIGYHRMTSMPAGVNSWRINSGVGVSNRITAMNSNSVTLGNGTEVNAAGATYYGYMLGGSSSDIYLGTYVGTGAIGNVVSGVGFAYGLLITQKDTANGPAIAFKNNSCSVMLGTAAPTNTIVVGSNGFTINNIVVGYNTAGSTYYFVAIKESSLSCVVTTYNGNSTDNTVQSTVGFTPSLVIIRATTNTTGYETALKLDNHPANTSTAFTNITAETNAIKSIISGGVNLGTNIRVNSSGVSYLFIALKDNPYSTQHSMFLSN